MIRKKRKGKKKERKKKTKERKRSKRLMKGRTREMQGSSRQEGETIKEAPTRSAKATKSLGKHRSSKKIEKEWKKRKGLLFFF